MQVISQPLTIFLIGITGDLAKKKVLKAIYQLHSGGHLPEHFTLVGNARRVMSADEFAHFVKEAVQPKNEGEWQSFAKALVYISGDVEQRSTFEELRRFHDQRQVCGNHLWYLATLPRLYTSVVENIGAAGLAHVSHGWTKILLEKPFGTDLQSAQELNKALTNIFSEDQIYRIDHFLAKEPVQNLLAFRFANGVFEKLWNRDSVDHIQITSAETMGVEGRESFYDQTGTLRDVVQNHLLQMLAVTMLDEPASLKAVDIRARRRELLEQLRPLEPLEVPLAARFGQYSSGKVAGNPVLSYLEENGIPSGSHTETAVALRCFVESDRWHGVPIYLRAGKRLEKSVTEISLQFKEPRNSMFAGEDSPHLGNVLTLRIQPNEGVVIRVKVKEPGLHLRLQEVPMQFCYKNEFAMDLIEAYVKLIYDAVMDDTTLFPHAQSIEATWKFIQPLLDYKERTEIEPDLYQAGTWGPRSFDELMAADDRAWIQPSVDVCSSQ